jgi:hypothetical protein
MHPPIFVRDAAAGVVVVVVQIGRQDDRCDWWLSFGASHASSVAGLSSVTPCVLNRPPHQQPPGEVKERQAACLGLRSHDDDDLVDPLGLAALVAAPCVHLLLHCAALARLRWLNADAFQ